MLRKEYELKLDQQLLIQRNNISSTISELTEQNKSLIKKTKQLEEDLQRLEEEKYSMKEELKHHKSELKSKLDESVVECEHAKRDLNLFKTKNQKAQDQITELMKQIELERQKLESVEKKNMFLEENLEKKKEENKKLDAAFLSMSSSIQGRINDAA